MESGLHLEMEELLGWGEIEGVVHLEMERPAAEVVRWGQSVFLEDITVRRLKGRMGLPEAFLGEGVEWEAG
jgi:hypothetical protein